MTTQQKSMWCEMSQFEFEGCLTIEGQLRSIHLSMNFQVGVTDRQTDTDSRPSLNIETKLFPSSFSSVQFPASHATCNIQEIAIIESWSDTQFAHDPQPF